MGLIYLRFLALCSLQSPTTKKMQGSASSLGSVVLIGQQKLTTTAHVRSKHCRFKSERRIVAHNLIAMLGTLRRAAKDASRVVGRAGQLQQQRFLNIHEYQVLDAPVIECIHTQSCTYLPCDIAQCTVVHREQN